MKKKNNLDAEMTKIATSYLKFKENTNEEQVMGWSIIALIFLEIFFIFISIITQTWYGIVSSIALPIALWIISKII